MQQEQTNGKEAGGDQQQQQEQTAPAAEDANKTQSSKQELTVKNRQLENLAAMLKTHPDASNPDFKEKLTGFLNYAANVAVMEENHLKSSVASLEGDVTAEDVDSLNFSAEELQGFKVVKEAIKKLRDSRKDTTSASTAKRPKQANESAPTQTTVGAPRKPLENGNKAPSSSSGNDAKDSDESDITSVLYEMVRRNRERQRQNSGVNFL